jgi:hypothetical protein
MHLSRTHDIDWDGPPAVTRRSRRKQALDIAGAVAPATRTGAPTLPVVRTPALSEYQGQVLFPEWVEHASKVLHGFLRTRHEAFTTPEDLWPLLDAPEEMREMVQVVRRALRGKWMTEVAAKRLTGVYRTRDGVEFKMNKLVPVYESLIAEPRDDPAPHGAPLALP